MKVQVDVCICTYRRNSLVDTFASISRLRLPDSVTVRVIVADNDDMPSARAIVETTGSDLGLNYVYLHAPARNIAVARNACLNAAEAPLLAFIDDDETATEFWLANLIALQASSGATIVFGPITAIYPPRPAWLGHADLHSIKPVMRKLGHIETGYTSNVLINRAGLSEACLGRRFDPELGRSGGEDTSYFHQLYILGATLVFCPDAIVHEIITPSRASLLWLVKRSFRSGQTHGRLVVTTGNRRAVTTMITMAKLIYCLASAAVRVGSPAGWRRSIVRGSLHAGVIANCFGIRDLQLY